MTIAYISIGSNLAFPIIQADTAVLALNRLPSTRVLLVSEYYRTSPLGQLDQPDYLNAVVEINTNLDAYALLDKIQSIEIQQGRKRTSEHWGPRTLDLDIILFGNEIINTVHLTIPHYDIKNRGFMLWPLLEIAPQLYFPSGESIKDTLLKLGTEKPKRWKNFLVDH